MQQKKLHINRLLAWHKVVIFVGGYIFFMKSDWLKP